MKRGVLITPRKILIIRLSAIGDVARTLPALRALRATYASAFIAWVVEDSAADLLRGHPDLDRVFVLERSQWKKDFRSLNTCGTPFLQLASIMKDIRKEGFDLALDFHGILKSGLISFFSGAAVRAGLRRTYCKEANYLFNNYHVDVGTNAISRIERNLRFVGFLGIAVTDHHEPVIPISDVDRASIDRFFGDHTLADHWPLIAIHPGTSRKTLYKRWDPSCYAALADRLIEQHNAKIVWTWGPGELSTVQAVVAMMKHDSIIAGSVTLKQLAELFRRCALFVGSDSGPMHIASFMKTPVVVIYGPTDPVVNAPYRQERSFILRKDVSCNPCREKNCSRLDRMAAVTTEEVFHAATELLGVEHPDIAGSREQQANP